MTEGEEAAPGARWVGTWVAAPQLTETHNMPPAPGLTGATLRQVVFTSIAGRRLRVRLSNEFGDGPVVVRSVHVALSAGAGRIDPRTDVALAFVGAAAATIPAGRAILSDPFDFALPPLTRLAITIAFDEVPGGVTGHPGARTTSYLQAGDWSAAPSLGAPASTAHWYVLAGVDVIASAGAAAVVTLGDSITDGYGTTTDVDDRWPDVLSRRLRANPATARVAVLNQGMGGNTVLPGGLGPPVVDRFARDALGQNGVRWLILFEGVNDIGLGDGSSIAAELIAAYAGLIDRARAQGLRVYGAPILPFGGSGYDSADNEAARRAVNDWIRGSGRFDAVIDFDAAVRDPADPTRLRAPYDCGDHLHLSPAGYRALAEAIDLALFL